MDFLYLKGGMSEYASGDYRLSAEELTSLRRSARSLMRQEISILENHTASWALTDRVPVRESFLDVGFELKVQPRVHAASDEVTLRLAFKLSDGDPGAGAIISTRDFESATRLRSGETFLLSGLMVGTSTGSRPSSLTSRFDLPDGPGEVVLALTPRIVRGPGFSASDLAAICVGTESHIALCDPGEISTAASLASLGVGSAFFPDSGGGGDEVDREAVRERLRQRLRSRQDPDESQLDSSGSSEEE